MQDEKVLYLNTTLHLWALSPKDVRHATTTPANGRTYIYMVAGTADVFIHLDVTSARTLRDAMDRVIASLCPALVTE